MYNKYTLLKNGRDAKINGTKEGCKYILYASDLWFCPYFFIQTVEFSSGSAIPPG